jgi:hypothetical protein
VRDAPLDRTGKATGAGRIEEGNLATQFGAGRFGERSWCIPARRVPLLSKARSYLVRGFSGARHVESAMLSFVSDALRRPSYDFTTSLRGEKRHMG